jgi:ParB family chromosome partitioning protein
MGMMEVPLARIAPNPWQPRSSIEEETLEELKESIRKRGILLPLIVTEVEPGSYQLIAGERRYRAAKALGLPSVPVVVKKVDEKDKLEVALIENIQRQNLNPIDEARAYATLKERFGLSQEEIASRVGKKRSTVANSARLLTLPKEMQSALAKGIITQGHAKLLLSAGGGKQKKLFRDLVKYELTVSATEEALKKAKDGRKAAFPDAEIASWQNDLRSELATKVRIVKRGKGGSIRIEFYSKEELKNIIAKLLKKALS